MLYDYALSKQWAGKMMSPLLQNADLPLLPAPAQEMPKVFCSKPVGEPHATSLTDNKTTPHLKKKQITVIASITPQPKPKRKSRLSRRTPEPISVYA